jgi:hypothetical protein
VGLERDGSNRRVNWIFTENELGDAGADFFRGRQSQSLVQESRGSMSAAVTS